MARTEIDLKAADWVSEVALSEDLASLLPELHAWLREDQAHRAAFAKYRMILRLAVKFAAAAQPDAGTTEFSDFLDACDKEKAQFPHLFEPKQ